MCNAAFAWVMENKDEQEREKLLADLSGATAEAEANAMRLLAEHLAQGEAADGSRDV